MQPLLVAMVGVSGKTWFANKLQAELGRKAVHLWLDVFYRDQSHLTRATLPNQFRQTFWR